MRKERQTCVCMYVLDPLIQLVQHIDLDLKFNLHFKSKLQLIYMIMIALIKQKYKYIDFIRLRRNILVNTDPSC